MARPGDLIGAAQDDPDAAGAARPADDGEAGASLAVTALYRGHALGLTRLAFVMLGDRQAAEDVVQEAFCGLYRAWDRLPDHGNVHGYLRVSVLNGCRSALRRNRRVPRPLAVPAAASAEAEALAGEEQRATVAALRRLRPGSGRPLSCVTSPNSLNTRRRWPWESAAGQSSPRPPGRWRRWAGCSGRTSERAGRPAPPGPGAESGQITPDSLPDLRLPGRAARQAGHPRLAALRPPLGQAAGRRGCGHRGDRRGPRPVPRDPGPASRGGYPAGLLHRSPLLRVHRPGRHIQLRLARDPDQLGRPGPLHQGPRHQHGKAAGFGQPAEAVQRLQRDHRRGQRTGVRVRGHAFLAAQRRPVAQARGA